MLSDFLESDSVPGVRFEHAFDKAFAVVGQGDFFWELELVGFDASIGVFDSVGLEGWFSENKGVEDDSDSPDVDLK